MPSSDRLARRHWLHIAATEPVLIPELPIDDWSVKRWLDEHGNEIALGYTVSGENYLYFPGVVTFAFSGNDDRVIAAPQLGTNSALIEDLFWRSALPLVLQTQGVGALHASAVLTPAGVVGFCAQAGSGKSTLAYGLSLRGYPIWTDDALVFDALEKPAMATSLPFKVRMRPEPADYYQVSQLSKGSASQLQGNFQQASQAVAPVRAIVELQRDFEESPIVSLTKMEGAAALIELLKHAYAFSLSREDQRRSISQQYMNLAAQVPVFQLQFPSGLAYLPLVLDRLERFLDNELP